MQRIDPPKVRRGEVVTARHFEQMGKAIRACRLLPGPGVRLRESPSGTVVEFDANAAQSFAHPWLVSLSGTSSATIRAGTINRVPATIKNKALDDEAPPVLEFGRPRVDSEGRGWICAEVTCDPDNLWSVVKVEIVQVADPDTEDGGPAQGLPNAAGGALPLRGNRARHALAMLRLRDSGRLDVYQVTFTDLEHRVKLAPDQRTATRHFFE